MFEHVRQFEEQIADFYGAPYAVATDSCTHAIELCLRLHYPLVVPQIPKHIPFCSNDFYEIGNSLSFGGSEVE